MTGFAAGRSDLSTAEVERQEQVYGGLADAVRGLVDATIRSTVPDDRIRAVEAAVRSLTAELRESEIDGPSGIRYNDEGRSWNWGNAAVGVRNALAPPMELLEADIAFHDAVYDAAANGRLSEAWQAIRSQVLHFQGVRVRLSAAGGYGAMLADEHRELVRVFRTGRPAAIAKAASAHAASAREALVAALGF